MAEVVVVGASVAGAATAIHLARLGREVVLLDKAEFPRRKACGEGLFPRGVRELRELGALDRLDGGTVLESLRFQGYGYTAEARLGSAEEPALGVSRTLLDQVLLRQAKAEGVEIRPAVQAELNAEIKGTYSLNLRASPATPTPAEQAAPLQMKDHSVIVGADGLNSGLRKQAGLEGRRRGRRYGLSAHVELRKAPEPVVDVFFRPGFEVYVTPVGGRCVNVAVLMSKPLTRMLAGAADGAFEELLLRERCLPPGWRLADAPLASGPFLQRPRRLWNRNLVLVGDAAGFFDGITGEGMSLALASARDCAEAVDAFVQTGEAKGFREYERKRRRLARNSELLGRLTLLLARRGWSASRAIRGLARHPDSFSRLVAVSSGEASLRGLRPLDVLAPILG